MSKSNQKTIRFTRDYQVQNDAGTTYEEGQIVTLSEASALHFVSRDAAVFESEPEKKAATKKKVAKKAASKKAD